MKGEVPVIKIGRDTVETRGRLTAGGILCMRTLVFSPVGEMVSYLPSSLHTSFCLSQGTQAVFLTWNHTANPDLAQAIQTSLSTWKIMTLIKDSA